MSKPSAARPSERSLATRRRRRHLGFRGRRRAPVACTCNSMSKYRPHKLYQHNRCSIVHPSRCPEQKNDNTKSEYSGSSTWLRVGVVSLRTLLAEVAVSGLKVEERQCEQTASVAKYENDGTYGMPLSSEKDGHVSFADPCDAGIWMDEINLTDVSKGRLGCIQWGWRDNMHWNRRRRCRVRLHASPQPNL